MVSELIDSAKNAITSSARTMDATQLRGDVRVIHWDAVRDALMGALEKLREEVQAAQAAMLASAGGDDVGKLKMELAEAKALILKYEEACDFLALVQDFDAAKFVAEINKLRELVDGIAPKFAATAGRNLPTTDALNAMASKADDIEAKLRELSLEMLEGKGHLGLLVSMVKVTMKGERLWAKLETIDEYIQLLSNTLH